MSRRMKITCVFGAIAIVTAGILVWSGLAHSGASELENWIGRQVVGALQSYVTPLIAFNDLHYEPPRGVTVEGLRFTAGDSRILLIDRVALELAEIPRTGRPIKISRVSLDRPQVRFITDTHGELLGWSGFIRPDPLKDPASVPQGKRFSDILELRHVELHDGRIVYDQGDGREAMTIPGIELALDTPPAAEAGWYNLIGTFKRSPLLQAAFDARINLDTALLEVKQLSLNGELGEKQYATLPPPVQELLRRNQIQGTLTATLSGSVPIAEASASTVQWNASLQQARFAYKGTVVPVDTLQTNGKYPGGPVSLTINGLELAQENQSFVKVKQAAITVDHLPNEGKPLQVDRVFLDGLQFSLTGKSDKESGGWRSLQQAQATVASGVTAIRKILRDFSIGALSLRNAGVRYHLATSGRLIEIAGCDADLKTTRSADNRTLTVEAKFSRAPLVTAQFQGSIPLDDAPIDLTRLQLDLDLSPAVLQQLSDPLREAATNRGLQGRVSLTAHGRIMPDNLAGSQIETEITATNARAGISAVLIGAESAHVHVHLPAGDMSANTKGLSLRRGDLSFFTTREASLEATLGSGAALVIKRLGMTNPSFEFVREPSGELAGWSAMKSGGQHGPSIQVRQIELHGADFLYRASAQEPPTAVEGVDLSLALTPSGDARSNAFTAKLRRQPLFEVSASGTYNPVESILDLQQARLTADITEKSYAVVPARMRDTLQRYQLAGRIELSGHARIPLASPGQTGGEARLDMPGSQIETDIAVTSARAAIGAMHIGAESAHVQVHLPAGDVSASTKGFSLRRGDLSFFTTREASLEATLGSGAVLVIKRLGMTNPSFEFVREPSGELAGWSALNGGGGGGPSIQLRQVELRGAGFLYRASAQQPPTAVDGVDLSLTLKPSGDAQSHAFTAKLSRQPLIDVTAAGTYDPVESILDLQQAQLTANITEQSYAAVPARMRETLQRHQLVGRIELSGHARFPLANPGQTRGEARLDITNGRVAIGQTAWPVQEFHVKAGMPAGPVEVAARGVSGLSGNLKFFSLQELKFEMPEIPSPGRPFEVRRLELQTPSVLLRHTSDGQLAGWSSLLSSAADGSPTHSAAGLDRLVLLEEMQIKGGEVTYDPVDGSPSMSLPGIDLVLRMPSISQVPDRHGFKGTIRRDPVLSVSFDGQVNVDEARLDLTDCQISADLGDREYGTLPPVLQEFLRKHEVRGDFDATVTGRIPLRDPLAMDTKITATLQNAHVALGETVWPLKRLEASGTVVRNRVDARYDASLLDGAARGTATCGLLGDQPFNLTWQIEGARLERTLRIIEQSEPRYSGRMSSQGNLAGKVGQVPATLSGQANLAITDARLRRMPIIREVLILVLATPGGLNTSDSARVNVQFRPDRVNLSDLDVTSALVRLRGGGDVLYDGRIDMKITADLLQRVGKNVDRLPVLDKIQPFKRVTGLIDNITDRLMVYEVRGTMSAPSVRPRPLGLGK